MKSVGSSRSYAHTDVRWVLAAVPAFFLFHWAIAITAPLVLRWQWVESVREVLRLL